MILSLSFFFIITLHISLWRIWSNRSRLLKIIYSPDFSAITKKNNCSWIWNLIFVLDILLTINNGAFEKLSVIFCFKRFPPSFHSTFESKSIRMPADKDIWIKNQWTYFYSFSHHMLKRIMINWSGICCNFFWSHLHRFLVSQIPYHWQHRIWLVLPFCCKIEWWMIFLFSQIIKKSW